MLMVTRLGGSALSPNELGSCLVQGFLGSRLGCLK